MAITRRLSVRDKIFSKDELAKLLKLLSSHYQEPKEKWARDFFRLDITEDHTTTVTIDGLPKNFEDILTTQIECLTLDVDCRSVGRHILLDIYHGDNSRRSQIRISGTDEDWVNRIHAEVVKLLDSIHPQNRLVRHHSLLIFVTLCFTLGWVLREFLFWYLSATGQTKMVPWSWEIFLLQLFISGMLGLAPAAWLTEKLRATFPSIEMRIGPKHSWLEAQQQKFVSLIVGIGIVGPSGDIIADLYRKLS